MTWTVQSVQETHTTTAEASMTASVDHGRHRQLVSNSFVWAGYIYIIAKKLQKKYTELKFKSYKSVGKKCQFFFCFCQFCDKAKVGIMIQKKKIKPNTS
jgi:hypothetical protein